jgi:hypothetical protein
MCQGISKMSPRQPGRGTVDGTVADPLNWGKIVRRAQKTREGQLSVEKANDGPGP